jgi:hypothetical protein
MATNAALTEDDVRLLINDLIAIEAAAREAADTQEAQNRQYNDDLLSQLIAQENNDREVALKGLQTSVNQSITRIDGNVTQLQNLINSRLDLTNNNISNINASFEEKMALLESLRVIILDSQSKVQTLTGDENTVGSVANALFDAKAYTDLKVAEVLGGAPQLLDTLKELADSLGNDANFITTVNASIQDAKDAASSNKQEVLNLLSQSLIKKEKIIINQQHITNGYVELSHIDIVPDSLNAFMDRLGIFEGEDFQLQEVSGKTRLVFINSFAENGDEEIEIGSELRVKYWIV